MSDEADHANDMQQQLLEFAIKNNTFALAHESRSNCEDCGNPIPIERQKAVNAVRCVECQHHYERVGKWN